MDIEASRHTRNPALVALLVMLRAQSPFAETRMQPPAGNVYSREDASRTTFSCRFTDENGASTFKETSSIECEFRQVSIWGPEKAAQDNAESLSERVAKMFGGLKRFCLDPKNRESIERDLARIKAHPNAAWFLAGSDSQRWRAMCSCTTEECLRAILIEDANRTAETCLIYTSTWTLEFVRKGKTWVNIDETKACYSTITTTLAPAPDSANFWNLRTTKVPRPDAEPALCGEPQVVDMNSSWRSFGDFIQPNCSRFKFVP